MIHPEVQRSVAEVSVLARERSLRIAVVESLTTGGFAHAVGAGEAASEWFAGGIVAYMRDVKEGLLGVSHGVDLCSAECAEQLAAGGRELFGADVCVATTGVGGPDPEDGHAPGTVYLGWATEGDHGHRLLEASGPPEQVMSTTIDTAIDLLAARAEKIPPPSDSLQIADLP